MILKSFFSAPEEKSNICVITQSKNEFEGIHNVCNDTWKDIFLERGYDIFFVDYTKTSKDFIDILLDKRFKEYEYIITMFDDLYFELLNIPSMASLYKSCLDLEIDYIRLDGRPPNFSTEKITIDNIDFYKIKELKKYSLSTVLACFNKETLSKLKKNGVTTAWEIETFVHLHGLNAYAPNKRNANYRNLIVKGRIDLIQLYLIGSITISLSHSIKKIIYRAVKRIMR